MQTLKAEALYFALVFAAGFALGTIRVLLVAPRVGERTAELMEAPFLVAVSSLAAPAGSFAASPCHQHFCSGSLA